MRQIYFATKGWEYYSEKARRIATTPVLRQNSVCLRSLQSMRFLAIDDPRSPDCAIYATLKYEKIAVSFRKQVDWGQLVKHLLDLVCSLSTLLFVQLNNKPPLLHFGLIFLSILSFWLSAKLTLCFWLCVNCKTGTPLIVCHCLK